jgi:VWFA-related protein
MPNIRSRGAPRACWSTAIAVLAAAAGLLAFAPQTQQPTFRAAVDLIAVDVQVVDNDGRPIGNLGREKFGVTIDGRQRRVASVDLVRLEQAPPSGTVDDARPTSGPVASNAWPSSAPVGRTFVLAFDAGSFNIGESRGAAGAARSFVEALQPTDLVGLYTFPLGPQLNPTRDRAAIRRSLDGVVGNRQAIHSQFNLSPAEVVDINAEAAAMGMRSAPAPTRGNQQPTVLLGNESETLRRVQLRECGSETDRRCVESIEQEAQALAFYYEGEIKRGLDGLGSLIRRMGEYPGRKTVVVLSGGMPASDRPGGRPDLSDEARTIGEEAARGNVTIYALHIDNSFLRTFSAETRRNDKMPVSRERESVMLGRLLDQFAGSSGGTLLRVLVGSGEQALDRVLLETSAYYMLGVEPAESDRDGHTHQLKVKVDQRGATVRSRTWVLVPKKRT